MRSLLAPNTPIVVGQRIYTDLYARGYGTVYALYGEQRPEANHSGIMTGSNASFDIVFDDGGTSLKLSESVLRGVQWKILSDIVDQEFIDQALQFASAEKIRDDQEKQLRAEKRELRRQEAIAANPHLVRTSNDQSSYVTGAKNIRTELKAAFPGVKFSVRSSSYSMGCSIDVRWDLGPTSKDVEAITDKYQEGHFDGMTDSYDYDAENVWPDLFGGAKYVFAHREYPEKDFEEIARAVCQLQGIEWSGHQTMGLLGENDTDYASTHIRQITSKTTFPPNSSFTGVRHRTAEDGDDAPWAILTFVPRGTNAALAPYCVESVGEVGRAGKSERPDQQTDDPAGVGHHPTGSAESVGDAVEHSARTSERQQEIKEAHGINPKPPVNLPGLTLGEELRANRLARESAPLVDNLRLLALRLDSDIESKRLPSTQNPTPKRNRERDARLIEADHLERVAGILRALADLHEKGTCPTILAKIRTKAALLPLLRTKVDTSGGYYSIRDTGEFCDTTPLALAAQGLLSAPDPEAVRLREIEQLERGLITTSIPGFFQTPRRLAQVMIQYADIEDGHACLEPSAGNGNIADLMPGCACIEPRAILRQILERKGHRLVGEDLLTHHGEYDRIVMNPPFENGQDMQHVRHAFGLLRDGGRLVAILSPAYTFHSSKAAVAFREWISDKVEHEEEVPAGTFAGPETVTQTNISARLVVLRT